MQTVGIGAQELFGIAVWLSSGLFLTYAVFPGSTVSVAERTVLSLSLSLLCVPLMVFYASFFGIPVSPALTATVGAITVAISGIVLWYRHHASRP